MPGSISAGNQLGGVAGRDAAAALAAGCIVAATLNYLAFRYPSVALGFEPTGARMLTVLGAAGAALWLAGRPRVALVLLACFVQLNLSQVLVRQHGWPSLFPLITLPLVFAALSIQHPHRLRTLLLHPVTLCFVCYATVVKVSTVVARDQLLADGRAFELTKGLLVFGLIAGLVRTIADLRAVLWTMLTCAVLLASLGLFQAGLGSYADEFGGFARVKYAHIVGTTFEPRIAGPLGDPNFFAQMLILVVPFGIILALHERWLPARVVAAAASVVITAGIVFTYSRGGAVALALTLALALLPVARVLRWRRTLAILLLGVALTAALVPRDFLRRLTTLEQFLPSDDVLRVDTSFEERRLLTTSAWLIFADHPLIGVGAGNYTYYFDEYVGRLSSDVREYEVIDDVHYPHNLYLEIAAETGASGLVAFAALIAATFAVLYRSIRRSRAEGAAYAAAVSYACGVALVGYLASALFLHGHFQRSTWIVLALGVSVSMMNSRRPES